MDAVGAHHAFVSLCAVEVLVGFILFSLLLSPTTSPRTPHRHLLIFIHHLVGGGDARGNAEHWEKIEGGS